MDAISQFQSLNESLTLVEDLELRLQQKDTQLRDLATMGAVITGIHEIDAVLSVVMDMAVRLVDGEVGLILLEDKSALKVKASWGIGEKFAKSLMYEDNLDLPTYCFRSRQTLLLANLGLRTEEGILVNSVIAVPIGTAEKSYGVLLLINKGSGGNYTDDDRELLEMLLNFVSVAIENSRLMQERLLQQKVEQEMAFARQVQETILPKDLQQLPGVEIGAVYVPAREVGGDFYDILRTPTNAFYVILGDVSNKGVPAAIIMAAASGIIKAIIAAEPEIRVADLAARVNDLIVEGIVKDRDMFVTLFLCRFDLKKKQLSFCNAGHLPGLWWDNSTSTPRDLAIGGPIIGQFGGVPYRQQEIGFDSGDRLFLFTDGLTESANSAGELFGRERVSMLFSAEHRATPQEFCRRVRGAIEQFAVNSEEDMRDDFTVLEVTVV